MNKPQNAATCRWLPSIQLCIPSRQSLIQWVLWNTTMVQTSKLKITAATFKYTFITGHFGLPYFTGSAKNIQGSKCCYFGNHLPGGYLINQSSLCKSFEDLVPLVFIYVYLIFKIVGTWQTWRLDSGIYSNLSNGNQLTCLIKEQCQLSESTGVIHITVTS